MSRMLAMGRKGAWLLVAGSAAHEQSQDLGGLERRLHFCCGHRSNFLLPSGSMAGSQQMNENPRQPRALEPRLADEAGTTAAAYDVAALLKDLGFNDTEAAVYCELLRSPRSTGYRVAKSIGKSQANVYGALNGLTEKGAVTLGRGDITEYSAVSPDELFPRLSRQYEDKADAARSALTDIAVPPDDAAIQQLGNAQHVYDRAAQMCAAARDSIAFELVHEPFRQLTPELDAARARGVGVAGVTFHEGDEVPGCFCILSMKASRAGWWPGEQLTLVTDAKEALVASFDRETGRIIHALHTSSTYLACLLHSAIVDAIMLNQTAHPSLQGSFNKRLFGKVPAGYVELIKESSKAAS